MSSIFSTISTPASFQVNPPKLPLKRFEPEVSISLKGATPCLLKDIGNVMLFHYLKSAARNGLTFYHPADEAYVNQVNIRIVQPNGSKKLAHVSAELHFSIRGRLKNDHQTLQKTGDWAEFIYITSRYDNAPSEVRLIIQCSEIHVGSNIRDSSARLQLNIFGHPLSGGMVHGNYEARLLVPDEIQFFTGACA